MKKFLVTILAVIYLATSTGTTINIHYCMGKKYDLQFFNHKKCSKCGMRINKPGCCKTEYQLCKIKDNHIGSENVAIPFIHFSIIYFFNSALIINSVPLKPVAIINSSHSPPLYNGIPAYISHCIYRI